MVGAVATMLTASAAMAADPVIIPPPAPPPPPPPAAPVMDWTGPYIGAVLGYGMGSKEWTFPAVGAPAGPLDGSPVETHAVQGFLAGIEGGFRFGLGGVVLGVEADWAWTNISGSSLCGTGDAWTCMTDLDWLATVTGQIGFGAGSILPYFEFGVAFADENFTITGAPFVAPGATGSITNRGWLLGGGVVFAMGGGSGLYVKAEYNYINFGTDPITVTDGAATQTFDLAQRLHTFKLGLGFMF
jgi:outer membrane immunogenic protein